MTQKNEMKLAYIFWEKVYYGGKKGEFAIFSRSTCSGA
jgi:hypothetical protein